MPTKNSVKTYIENGYYHIYNRGVEQRDIFLDDSDYRFFLFFLKYYLDIPTPDDFLQKKRSLNTEISLVAYCLMPNHFHLLLRQNTIDGMTKLLRAISTNYACYFNKKYKRIGGLFQGKYRAILVENDEYLLHLSRYIHLNPKELIRVGPWKGSDPLKDYPYSSYAYYLGLKNANWLHINDILSYFLQSWANNHNDFSLYKDFVESHISNSAELSNDYYLE